MSFLDLTKVEKNLGKIARDNPRKQIALMVNPKRLVDLFRAIRDRIKKKSK